MDLNATANQLTQAFNSHDPAAVGELYSADQVTLLPGLPPVAGRVAKELMLAGYFRAFPDLRLEIPLIICSGQYIVCEGTMAGTNTGPLVSPEGEMPATGRRITLPLAFILTFGSDGLIHEDHTYFDEASFLKQLGLLA
jgi:predicted ester cyclase